MNKGDYDEILAAENSLQVVKAAFEREIKSCKHRLKQAKVKCDHKYPGGKYTIVFGVCVICAHRTNEP